LIVPNHLSACSIFPNFALPRNLCVA
jgi:hypothetical protein